MTTTKVNLANTVEGILPVANGGTGTSTGVAPGGSTTQVQYNNAGVFAGSSSFVFDGTNVGIGTSSPAANRKLTIGNTSQVAAIRINAPTGFDSFLEFTENSSVSANTYWQINKMPTTHDLQFWNGSERMRITSAGNVGIGQSSPSCRFDVNDSVSSRLVNFNSTGTNGPGVGLSNSGTDFAYFGSNKWALNGNLTDYGQVAVNNFIFGAGNTERMRITSAGNVGIGTSSPGAKLQVTTGGANSPGSNLSGNIGQFTSSGGIAYVTMGNGDSANQHRYVGAASAIQVFGKVTDAGVATEQMRIDSSGNVGIGTTSPTGKLNVVQNGTPVIAQFDRTDSGMGLVVAADSTGPYFRPTASGAVRWNNAANNAELMRIENDATFKFNSGYGSAATAYGCRAWVKFAGGSGSINGSGNVSSVTRNGTGNYTVNFSTAMPDANYAVTGATKNQDNTTTGSGNNVVIVCPISFATGSIGILTPATTTTLVDPFAVSVAIFR
jgi:hypothetical protein